MDIFIKRGFYTIGALNTTRIVYPYGIRQKVNRYWLLMSLSHFIACIGSGEVRPFEDGYAYFYDHIQEEHINFIYRCGVKNMCASQVFWLW